MGNVELFEAGRNNFFKTTNFLYKPDCSGNQKLFLLLLQRKAGANIDMKCCFCFTDYF